MSLLFPGIIAGTVKSMVRVPESKQTECLFKKSFASDTKHACSQCLIDNLPYTCHASFFFNCTILTNTVIL